MLDITKKILINSLCLSLLALTACEQRGEIIAKIYNGNKTEDLQGNFYATELGGLNYYITDDHQRESVLSMSSVDSIVFYFNNKNYVAEPLVSQSFSRERNKSDFSFFINKTDNKIVVDTVNNLNTILLFSEKTDVEKLKEDHKVKFHSLGK